MSCMYSYSSTWKVETLDITEDYLVDVCNSYRMQQCAIDNIADKTVVTEQGISKINVVYIGGKKLYGKELPSSDHFFWKSADMDQTSIEKLCSDLKWGLSNDD